ncbi:hypothetical protein [Amycolatopsis rubida]|uniref:Uncharacterized protein n=1 Tax=Amycolatopsis rubida TaxID=112413 RepID=A0A1I5XGM4_9PSEU|nr:hypothetical protein [Amycolatopsis rubida]SFQ31105.1 hypothetical protein SAMN05421854_110219 [Amycolatopsis rubida]
MTEPAEAPAFLGFAGWPVPVPNGWGDDIDPFEHIVDDPDEFFRFVGIAHADRAADQMIRARRRPGFRTFDLDDVARYNPDPTFVYGNGYTGSGPSNGVGAYTFAFLDRLAQKAEILRDDDRARAFEEARFSGPEEEEDDRRFGEPAAEFSAADMLAAADEFEGLVRALSDKTGARLPPVLAEKDRLLHQETQDRARLAELTEAIDQFIAVGLTAPEPPRTQPRREWARVERPGHDPERVELRAARPGEQAVAPRDGAEPPPVREEQAARSRLARPGTATARHGSAGHPGSGRTR